MERLKELLGMNYEDFELMQLFGLEDEFIEFQKDCKNGLDLYRMITGDDVNEKF